MTSKNQPPLTGTLLLLALLAPLAGSGGHARAQSPGPGALVQEAKAALLADYFDDKLAASALDLAAVQGMVQSLNGGKPEGPNALLDAQSTAELKGDLKGELVGIGAQIDYDEATGMALVMGVLPGSSAESGGLQAGDRILAVNGAPFRGRPQREVVSAIRGREGTSVRVSLLRASTVVEKSLTRKRLTLPSVEHLLLDDVGLVTLRVFNERTPGELGAALRALSEAQAHRLLLDLRSNPGGLFEKALEAAELLVPPGSEIVRTVSRGERVKRMHAKGQPILGRVPIVVLTDTMTASSAEVLAEALRASAGATLVGSRTLGKWRMERLHPLSAGYTLKFTIALLQSPLGQSFDGKGLAPDVEVAPGKEQLEHTRRITQLDKRLEADPQLKAGLHVLRLRR